MKNRKDNYDVISNKRNQFSVLADSDSDSDDCEHVVEDKVLEKSPVVSDVSVVEISKPTEGLPFRTWGLDESESRFSGEDVKKNIFSSPFSKNKNTQKQWSQPRFRDDNDGWTSIRWSQPQFQDTASTTTTATTSAPMSDAVAEIQEPVSKPKELSVQYEPRGIQSASQFPSLLTRGASAAVTPTPEDNLSAIAWAEKIKKSLEKAELARAMKVPEKSKECTGHLSFFRRSMTVDNPPLTH